MSVDSDPIEAAAVAAITAYYAARGIVHTPAAATAAVAADDDEDEEEVVVEESGNAAPADDTEPMDVPGSASDPPVSAERRALAAQIRPLLSPYGPLNFSYSLVDEPSIVPLPSVSLYPAAPIRSQLASASVAGATFHHNNAANPNRKRGLDEAAPSAEVFWSAVKPLREPPLVHAGRHAPDVQYDATYIAQSLSAEAVAAAAVPNDTHISDQATLQRIAAVQAFIDTPDLLTDASASVSLRRLWNAHEAFDPYRLMTHPQPIDKPPTAHPSPNAATTAARFEAFRQRLSQSQLVPLQLSPSLSFCSSHISLSLAELDVLHGVFTSARQRDPESIQAALRHPPPPQQMFLTFVDLSGAEGAGSEFLLWRRRTCNLRARGWGYDMSGSEAPANWSGGWSNAASKEQAKNFDVFHAPVKGDAAGAAAGSPAEVRLRAMSDENAQTFMRTIDMQTKGLGVQVALAAVAANPAPHMELQQASLSYRPSSALLYPSLLFQVDLALRTLCKGGTLVLQLYETHTPLTLSVLFLLFKCFESCALHHPAGVGGYGAGQAYVICKQFHHDRVAQRPSASPILAALTHARQMLMADLPTGDWSQRALVLPEEMRANPNFVLWVRKYNSVAHAYQLHCLLTLLQPTAKQASLIDYADPPIADGTTGGFPLLRPVMPPHHRIRITMLRYLGLPVADPFAPADTP